MKGNIKDVRHSPGNRGRPRQGGEMATTGDAFRQMTARRTVRVNILVTKAEKAEINEEAEARKLTVTEYFLRLHRRVREAGGSAPRTRKPEGGR